jgi:hypothetical protein
MGKFIRCAFVFLFMGDLVVGTRNPYAVVVPFSGDSVVPCRIADSDSDYIGPNDSGLAQAFISLTKSFYRDENHDYY